MSETKTELPPDEIVGPDENGIKIVTTYYINDKGQKVKRITKYKVTKRIVRVKRAVLERRKWAKFGACAGKPPGPDPSTTFFGEEVTLDLSLKHQPSNPLFAEQKTIIRCRNCGKEGHWTTQCKEPKRDSGSNSETPSETSATSGKYVPPNKRAGGSKYSREEPESIRLTNLPLDMTDEDLYELLASFGRTERVYLVRDHVTKESRGFAFISFVYREDAEDAMETLNGHYYDNMVLHAEWAKPRERDD
jgi:translation initiation factor 3 subunit G